MSLKMTHHLSMQIVRVYAWIIHSPKPIGFNELSNFCITNNIHPTALDDIISHLESDALIIEGKFGFFEDNTKRWEGFNEKNA